MSALGGKRTRVTHGGRRLQKVPWQILGDIVFDNPALTPVSGQRSINILLCLSDHVVDQTLPAKV